jgi:hypothetical protein
MRQPDRTDGRPRGTTLVRPLVWIASFLAVGVPYWSLSYRSVSLPDSLMTPALLVVAMAALGAGVTRGASVWRQALIIGGAVPAAVLARVTWEVMKDPTSHNLWPFEAVIAAAIGFSCALAGGVVAVVLTKVAGRTARGSS